MTAVGGLVDMLAGSLLALIPALAAELEGGTGDARAASATAREHFQGSLWVTIFSALLLALGSYSVLVGTVGLNDFIPMTIPVRLLSAVFCLWGYVSLRMANKKVHPWLLLLFGGVLFVLALLPPRC